MGTYHDSRYTKARKEYRCRQCNQIITKGAIYLSYRIGVEPCPFCGSERLRKTEWLIAADQGERDIDVIECLDCDAAAPVEIWNRRVSHV